MSKRFIHTRILIFDKILTFKSFVREFYPILRINTLHGNTNLIGLI